jgi:catechol 2,3-dioxygenase-like lactoylglutathione lyase family enzyme
MTESEKSRGDFRFVFFAEAYEETIAFYREGLGFDLAGGWDRGPDDRGTLLLAASGIIEVIKLPASREFVPPRGAWLLIEVEDVEAFYRRAQAKHLNVKEALAVWPWGARGFKLSDPGGVELSLFSFTQEDEG